MRIEQLAKRGFYAENTTGASTVGWANIDTLSDETRRIPNLQNFEAGAVMVIIWAENPSYIRTKSPENNYPLRAGMNIVYIPGGSWGVLATAGKFQLAALPL